MAVVFPGQTLGPAAEYSPGAGTHLAHAQVCSSLLGLVAESQHKRKDPAQKPDGPQKQKPKDPSSSKPTLSVRSLSAAAPASASEATKNVLPTVDSTVLARVTRISPRQATVDILVVEDTVCAEGFQGLVRVQDVRATEKDKVRIAESFRPGDIVRAVVISLGDQSNYYLSTASNLLGVIIATSDAGNAMYPVNWKEFRDPVTGVSENRKVAKPF